MIGVVGNMSGGKTYSSVEMMLEAVKRGHTVVTNIELIPDGVSEYLGVSEDVWRPFYWRIRDDEDELGPFEVHASDYESWPCGSPRGSATYERDMVFIFLDEVSSIFDSMTSGSSAQIQKVAAWARHTEKRGQMLYLIMQFENELHKRLRIHITEYVFCRNANSITIPFIRCKLPKFLTGYITRIHLMPDGETTIGRPEFVTLKQEIFDCYRTAQIVVGNNHVSPAAAVDFPADLEVLNRRLVNVCWFLFATIVFSVVLWLSL